MKIQKTIAKYCVNKDVPGSNQFKTIITLEDFVDCIFFSDVKDLPFFCKVLSLDAVSYNDYV